jgi:hypothetical protein
MRRLMAARSKLTAPVQYSSEQVTYHIMLLHEAGLIRAFDFSSDDFPDWRPGYLTWEGHEFLNVARESGRWNKAKTLVMEKGGGLVFEILKQVLLDQMKAHVFGSGTAS